MASTLMGETARKEQLQPPELVAAASAAAGAGAAGDIPAPASTQSRSSFSYTGYLSCSSDPDSKGTLIMFEPAQPAVTQAPAPAPAPAPTQTHAPPPPTTASAPDPRFAKCGFARLLGDNGLEYYVQKYEVVLGRKSKASNVDVVLGDSAVLSRQHAKISYNFDLKRWELTVEGKNGVSVNGNLHTPQSGPCVLQSQDFLQAGDYNFYFLLPKQPRKPRAPKSKAGTPTPPDIPPLQQQEQQQEQQQQPSVPWNAQQHPQLQPLQQQQQQQQQQLQLPQQQQSPAVPGLQPYSSGPLLPGVGSGASPMLGNGSLEPLQGFPDHLGGFSMDGSSSRGLAVSSMGSLELGLLAPAAANGEMAVDPLDRPPTDLS